MKKMSFVTKALVLLLMGTMLAGCSDDKPAKEAEKTEESVSKSEESKKTEESKTEENKTEESTSAQNTEETSETQNFGGGSEVNGGGIGDEELEAKYEEYFKNLDFDGKKISLVYTGDLGTGTESTMTMEFGSKDGSALLYIAAPASSGATNSCTIYFLEDKSAYLGISIAGEEEEYYKTAKLDDETFDSMNLASGLVDLDNTEREETDLVYVGEQTIDGVLYDELYQNDPEAGEDPGTRVYVYMNKKTGELGKIKSMVEGEEMFIDILPMDSIKLPAEFDNAQEQEAEDFTYTMAFAMLGVMMGGGE